jgi:hypothetical protein
VVTINDEIGANVDEDAAAGTLPLSEPEIHATIFSLLALDELDEFSFSDLISLSTKSFLFVCLGVLCWPN